MTDLFLPLPGGNSRKFRELAQANAGLVFNKFVDKWHYKEEKPGIRKKPEEFGLHEKKLAFIQQFTKTKAGKEAELERHAKRLKQLAKANSATGSHEGAEGKEPQPLCFENTSRFVTGMGLEHGLKNGFVWHHTLGVPYLPASGIKGMMRAWSQHWREDEKEIIWQLFGNERNKAPLQMGALIVFDALPTKPVQLAAEIITPHDGGWRANGPGDPANPLSPGDWHSPEPVPFLAVEEGNEFLFALGTTRNAEPDDLQTGYELLEQALEWIGFGAKTAIGMGRFETDAARERKEEERKKQATAAQEEWQPEIGDIVSYIGEDTEYLVIGQQKENGDFTIGHLDGSHPMITDKAECKLLRKGNS